MQRPVWKVWLRGSDGSSDNMNLDKAIRASKVEECAPQCSGARHSRLLSREPHLGPRKIKEAFFNCPIHLRLEELSMSAESLLFLHGH
ncbi:hypothetical protein M513_12800 [Trichuris suis]|uniref:Uncharacterized protein n=1 Tax=Trichuris suis TaxID=68888 RepID=A0A085LMX6_9BILA|nr:hypothetical protein M513_12800 [Trichuris suis]